jgi:hypothetical protein
MFRATGSGKVDIDADFSGIGILGALLFNFDFDDFAEGINTGMTLGAGMSSTVGDFILLDKPSRYDGPERNGARNVDAIIRGMQGTSEKVRVE